MTLRQWYASKALAWLLPVVGVPDDGPDELWDEALAKRAFSIADAMIKEGNK